MSLEREYPFEDIAEWTEVRGKPIVDARGSGSSEPRFEWDGTIPEAAESLLKADPLARAAWVEQSMDGQPKSASEWDLSYADRAALAGHTSEEIQNALKARRAHHGHKRKGDHYWPLTAGKALAWAREQSNQPPDGFSEGLDEEPPQSPENLPWVKSTAEVNATVLPPQKWAWKGILQLGSVNVIAAPPKTAKSTIQRALTAAVATGRNLLDIPTVQGSSCYFGLEESPRTTIERVQEMQLPADTPAWWITTGLSDDIEELQKQVVQTIRYYGASFAAIDSLLLFTGINKTEDYSEVTRAFRLIRRVAEETDCALLISHHTRKGDSTDPFQSILGSQAIMGAVDTAILLNRDPKTHRRSIQTRQRDGEDLWPHYFRLESGLLVNEGLVSEAASEGASRAIMQAMAGQNGGSILKGALIDILIKNKVGSRDVIRSALEDLIRSGRLRQEQKGRSVMVSEADFIHDDGLDS